MIVLGWRQPNPVVVALLVIWSLAGCAPLPKGEYWKGSFVHLDLPRYTFEVPDGWRPAKPADFPLLGFNRRVFATLNGANRAAFLERAELEMESIDTALISSGGAWIQIGSERASGGWYRSSDPLRFGLSERDKQALWERFASNRIQQAPATDRPKLTLESIDVVNYGLNRALRVRFRSDEARGTMHWTVLGVYTANDTISVAHLGTPENRDEGIAGLEAIATSIRFD